VQMFSKRWLSKKVASGLVSAVLLVNLLMPAIAAATVKRDQFSALFSVICTSSGVKVVDVSGNPSAPSHTLQDTVHCPLCVIGGSPALPSTALTFLAWFDSHLVFDQVPIQLAPRPVLWPSASPRGPPATS
jgi:Protein of unknown function (DUF2946)